MCQKIACAQKDNLKCLVSKIYILSITVFKILLNSIA